MELTTHEDHCIPYCADPRHAEDTLFFVAEEDWRLYEEDCKGEEGPGAKDAPTGREEEVEKPKTFEEAMEGRDRMAKRGKVKQEEETEPTANTGGGKQSLQPGKEEKWAPEFDGYFNKTKKPRTEDMGQCSTELVDMVMLCNAASRVGAGDLIWLSWNTTKAGRQEAPGFGSQLIALTADGARTLAANWSKWFPRAEHFDVALKQLLEKDNDCRKNLAAGYLFPALGHWDSHESMHGFGVRHMHWRERWINSGTRATPELTAEGRWQTFQIREFIPKGWSPVLRESIKFPEDSEELQWWTAALSVDPTLTEGMTRMSSQPFAKAKTDQGQLRAVDPAKGGVDEDPAFGEVLISPNQIMHPKEWKRESESYWRKFRGLVSCFERRNFTNNPKKVCQ